MTNFLNTEKKEYRISFLIVVVAWVPQVVSIRPVRRRSVGWTCFDNGFIYVFTDLVYKHACGTPVRPGRETFHRSPWNRSRPQYIARPKGAHGMRTLRCAHWRRHSSASCCLKRWEATSHISRASRTARFRSLSDQRAFVTRYAKRNECVVVMCHQQRARITNNNWRTAQ